MLAGHVAGGLPDGEVKPDERVGALQQLPSADFLRLV
jgi:hypothetical protein